MPFSLSPPQPGVNTSNKISIREYVKAFMVRFSSKRNRASRDEHDWPRVTPRLTRRSAYYFGFSSAFFSAGLVEGLVSPQPMEPAQTKAARSINAISFFTVKPSFPQNIRSVLTIP